MTDGSDDGIDRDAVADGPAAALALDCLEAGIEAAHPRRVTREHVRLDGDRLRIGDATYDLTEFDEVLVLGGGKAAAVAVELEAILGDRLDGGIVVTNDPRETERVEVRAGSHPVPGEAGQAGATAVLERARGATERTLVLGVVTGGASALLPAPAEGLSLDDVQRTTRGLLEAGATIGEINAVRKHCSAIKGGRLAAAARPATVGALLLSDVVGDDPSVIGSGPFVADGSTFADARAALDRHEVTVPDAVRERLAAGAAGEVAETPGHGDPAVAAVETVLVGTGLTACEAAAERAAAAGYEPLVLSSRVRGESREAAKTAVAIAEEARASGRPVAPPAVLVSGGETTVTVRGDGCGGPNAEFALSAAAELCEPGIVVAAIDTDGIDGGSAYAGGIVDADTVDAATALDALAASDAATALERAGAAIETGPTGTNVNDLRVTVVEPADGD